MSYFNENEEISVGDVVSKVSGKATQTYLGAAVSTAALTSGGTINARPVATLLIGAAATVGYAAQEAWDFCTSWF